MNSNAGVAPKDEPATTAKVIIGTSIGDIEIELWAREAPLACRNFIQLALEGYYDNTIFHRMIPGFMIQGGDPTGTGTGGQSIYGAPFKDEFHQRIKFSRRGMLAMANSGKNSNGSQFFITFAECNHLNKVHTIFGRVVGESIYKLLPFQQLDTDPNQNDRPLYPPEIKKIKVVLSPFDDIIPRLSQPQAAPPNSEAEAQKDKVVKKTEIKKLKNKNKLTF
jgi:peptidyl-prolyl cis-trans isomerase SDCCAG10